MANSVNSSKADFGGSVPYRANLDSLEFFGSDPFKRKRDNGILSINSSYNQLRYFRDVDINGGGKRIHKPGEGPLPGFTLPDTIYLVR